jgi:hypothetical protein
MGATIGSALRKAGRTVTIFDDNRPLCGTKPSGGHIKPSWISNLKKGEFDSSLDLLADVWGIKEEQFAIRPLEIIKTTVFRVDIDKVLQTARTCSSVLSVEYVDPNPVVRWIGGEDNCKLLVVATGSWGNLVSGVKIEVKQGISFRMKGKIATPFIQPWAPYKQIVAHQQSEQEIWVGDGTAILSENWNEATTQKCFTRCSKAINSKQIQKVNIGLRPYCKTKDPCLLKQLGPNAWLATGAGKNGTIAAGWAANQILFRAL